MDFKGTRPAHSRTQVGASATEIGADNEAMVKDPATFSSGSRIAASTPSPAFL